MDLLSWLKRNEADLVTEAAAGVARAHLPHYDAGGPARIRERIRFLLERVTTAVARRSLQPIVEHASDIADERYAAGFDLFEVQVVFNVLEETVWRRLLKECPPADLAEALGPVATALGAAKDALARRYVALATRSHSVPVDLTALFKGTYG